MYSVTQLSLRRETDVSDERRNFAFTAEMWWNNFWRSTHYTFSFFSKCLFQIINDENKNEVISQMTKILSMRFAIIGNLDKVWQEFKSSYHGWTQFCPQQHTWSGLPFMAKNVYNFYINKEMADQHFFNFFMTFTTLMVGKIQNGLSEVFICTKIRTKIFFGFCPKFEFFWVRVDKKKRIF